MTTDLLDEARTTRTQAHAAFHALHDGAGVSDQDRLRAMRLVKNAIIGNPSKKALFMELGILPLLLEIMGGQAVSLDLKVETAAVLGSLAQGKKIPFSHFNDPSVLSPLLAGLASTDFKLVEASARALKVLFQNIPPYPTLKHSSFPSDLIRLLREPGYPPRIRELAALIITRVSTGENAISMVDAIGPLVGLIDSANARVQESALDALASITKGDAAAARELASATTAGKPTLTDLISVANLLSTSTLPEEYEKEASQLALPILIKLFDGALVLSLCPSTSEAASVLERAPLIFSHLVLDNEEMQASALEGSAITKLAALITGDALSCFDHRLTTSTGEWNLFVPPTPPPSTRNFEKIKENALIGLSAVCYHREDCRKQVIDAKLLPHIVLGMSSPLQGVRSAACQCVRSLSRSVKCLRTALVDAGVVFPVIRLLSDESEGVRSSACATVCNLVLDFSPMKAIVVDEGGLDKVVSLLRSGNAELRLNAMWTLKNLAFKAESTMKVKLMQALGWDELNRLVDDEDDAVQEQGLYLLRNLAEGKEMDVRTVMNGYGERRLQSMLKRKLEAGNERWQRGDGTGDRIDRHLINTLYVISNISVGITRQKWPDFISDEILAQISTLMLHPNVYVRLATLWCAINFTDIEDEDVKSHLDRIARLRSHRFDQLLQIMLSDPDRDVREKAKTALIYMGVPDVTVAAATTAEDEDAPMANVGADPGRMVLDDDLDGTGVMGSRFAGMRHPF
ncbi:Armadillo repeat-containing protein 8 [Irineochytrium annulatum]|nr:Armadillo repeat-containing protein 8 [Irineochytrium annulatum]